MRNGEDASIARLVAHVARRMPRMSRTGLLAVLAAVLAAALLSMALVVSSGALAQTNLTGTTTAVNTGQGDQTDPHVSGDYVAYTSNADGTNRIRYHNLTTAADTVVPHSGEDDFLSDISGTRIVFTRVSSTSAIYTYTIGGASASEVAPSATANRRNPSIGGATVAWQDFSFRTSVLEPEIVVHDLNANQTIRLTDDALLDRTPQVGPDGAVVVWVKCSTTGTGCDVWKAVNSGGTWTSAAVTGSEGEESSPDTNGSVIVYASTRSGETDIFWKPVGGGTESRLSFAGAQRNPSISGSLIAFDHQTSAGTFDVMVFDMVTNTLYQIATTAANEFLSDIWVGLDGRAHVVYQSDDTGDFNIYAFSFQSPSTSVATLLDNLSNLVQSYNLQQGIENSLDVKLQNALKAWEALKAGDLEAACGLMEAFINEVTAQSGKALTTAQAADLIAAAEAVRAAMGCP